MHWEKTSAQIYVYVCMFVYIYIYIYICCMHNLKLFWNSVHTTKYLCLYIHISHHQVVLISQSLLNFFSIHSFCSSLLAGPLDGIRICTQLMYLRLFLLANIGESMFGVHRKTLFMGLSFLQQCPACLGQLTWMVSLYMCVNKELNEKTEATTQV